MEKRRKNEAKVTEHQPPDWIWTQAKKFLIDL